MAEWRKKVLAEWRNREKTPGGMAEWQPLGNPPLIKHLQRHTEYSGILNIWKLVNITLMYKKEDC